MTTTDDRKTAIERKSAALGAHGPLTADAIALLKQTICRGADDDELKLFIAVANKLGLDPFSKQIHAVKRYDSKAKREVMAIQVSIDGFRLQATRSAAYEGQVGPQWCGPDLVWRDVWISDEPPAAARVGVLRAGFREPLWSVCRYGAYVQMATDKDTREKRPTKFWESMPDVMLAKCAEASALRRAFPAELSGAYAPEEMGADIDDAPTVHREHPKRRGLDDIAPAIDGGAIEPVALQAGPRPQHDEYGEVMPADGPRYVRGVAGGASVPASPDPSIAVYVEMLRGAVDAEDVYAAADVAQQTIRTLTGDERKSVMAATQKHAVRVGADVDRVFAIIAGPGRDE